MVSGRLGARTRRGGRGAWKPVWVIAVVLATAGACLAVIWSSPAARRSLPAARHSLCGQVMAGRPHVRHVIVVMLENWPDGQVTSSPAAPFQARLGRECGHAVQAFAATHGSGPNYLAVSAGQYPSSSVRGCDFLACVSNQDNIYQQLDRAGLTWKAYQEAMPVPCDKSSSWPYKIGHDPVIFYAGIDAAECQARVVPVADLTARAGVFYDDLRSGRLPSVAWVTPDRINDGEKPCRSSCELMSADRWLRDFLTLVGAARAYQDGSVLVMVTYDEARGPDNKLGENCADKAADLGGLQPSCHVPLFVVWQYARSRSTSTFFTPYSLTRTIEDLFGLPCLAHACSPETASLTGSGFGF
jgi:phosphatidylinositol-3-phosphatase